METEKKTACLDSSALLFVGDGGKRRELLTGEEERHLAECSICTRIVNDASLRELVYIWSENQPPAPPKPSWSLVALFSLLFFGAMTFLSFVFVIVIESHEKTILAMRVFEDVCHDELEKVQKECAEQESKSQ